MRWRKRETHAIEVNTQNIALTIHLFEPRPDGITKLELMMPDSVVPKVGTKVEVVLSKVVREYVEQN